MAGRDEKVGLAAERLYETVAIGGGLEQPERRRAYGDDPPTGYARAVDGFGRLIRDLAPLGMHGVVEGVVNAYRQKGTGAHMQS